MFLKRDTDSDNTDPKPPSAFRSPQDATRLKTADNTLLDIGSTGIPTVSGSRDFEDFVYILSHDVRGSVRALLEIPQWIKEDLIDDGVSISGSLSENLTLMESHARRLDTMLVDLLTYSRVGRKQSMRSIHLEDVLNNVILAQNIPADFEITYDLKLKSIKMGEDDVETLLSALISNAFKHHDKKRGFVRISTCAEDDHFVLCVEDDGPGIPVKFRERVFEAMTTLKSRDEVEGSGMGLAIVRKIVDLYGGNLEWLEPDNGTGTSLKIKFPT